MFVIDLSARRPHNNLLIRSGRCGRRFDFNLRRDKWNETRLGFVKRFVRARRWVIPRTQPSFLFRREYESACYNVARLGRIRSKTNKIVTFVRYYYRVVYVSQWNRRFEMCYEIVTYARVRLSVLV